MGKVLVGVAEMQREVINMKNAQLFYKNFNSRLFVLDGSTQMPKILNLTSLKLKPLFCVVFGLYAFTSSYPVSFTPSQSHAQQQVNCKTWNDAQKVISWTGDCVNGLLEGDGELVFEMAHEGKTALVKIVSKYNRGDPTGVYFTKSRTPANGLYWSMLQVTNDSVPIATGDSKTPNYDMLTYKW